MVLFIESQIFTMYNETMLYKYIQTKQNNTIVYVYII